MESIASIEGDIEDIYELAPLQRGMLVESLAQPEAGVYISQESVRFGTELTADRVRAAWRPILDRHSVFRTEFFWEGLEEPLQVVRSDVEVPLKVWNWRECERGELSERVEQLLVRRRKEGLDLQSAPLLNIDLVQGPERRDQLLLTMHHIIVDGWSRGIVRREFIENWLAIENDADLSAEPAPPFREYIEWLSELDREPARRFWRDELKGVQGGTLPEGRRDGSDIRKEFDVEHRRLDWGEGLSPKELAEQVGVSTSIVFQAAWALLLSRYANTSEVIYGLTLSGRTADLADIESRVGMFINTVPVRLEIPSGGTLQDWLGELQRKQAKLRANGFVSIPSVRDWAGISNEASLTDAIFLFQNQPGLDALEENLRALKVEDIEERVQTHNPLTFAAGESGLKVWYESTRYRSEQIERMTAHFVEILRSFLDAPDVAPLGHQMVTGEERRRYVEQWATGEEFSYAQETVPEMFEKRVEQHPERTALEVAGSTWSYEDLERRANAVARELVALGVEPGEPVGVAVERSPELIAALFGTLKAGAAYVALQPSLPDQRIEYMVDDAGVEVVVASESVADFADETVLRMSSTLDDESGAGPPEVAYEPDQTAYILYTSGTTGQPKGVMIPHRAMTNLVRVIGERFPEGEGDAILQKTPYSFDISVSEIFNPLTGGAKVVMTLPESERNASKLGEKIREFGVSVLRMTPTELANLLEAERYLRTDLESAAPGGESDRSRVNYWKRTWDYTYRETSPDELEKPELNTEGWRSSYTGEAFSDEVMRDWLAGCLAPLEERNLGRTLEVGCGTGMVLFELASRAEEYVGMDFSERALEYVADTCEYLDGDYSHIRLHRGEAAAIDELEGEFDTVLLNSVVQYFPSRSYFDEVVRTIVSKLRPGGQILLGDVRDERLDFAFHASVQRERVSLDTTREELRSRAYEECRNDQELRLSPEYLVQLASGLEGVSHVDVHRPPSDFQTEMAKFRYGVVFHRRGNSVQYVTDKTIRWSEREFGLEELREFLDERDRSVTVTGIPDGRVSEAIDLQEWLQIDGTGASVSDYDAQEQSEVHQLDTLRAIGEQTGHRVTVSPSAEPSGRFVDVSFESRQLDLPPYRPVVPLTAKGMVRRGPPAVRRSRFDARAEGEGRRRSFADSVELQEGVRRISNEPVRRILSCGETLTSPVRDDVFEVWPRAELINLWGPTEACVYASEWKCQSGDDPSEVPIGSPLPNYSLYALDESFEPVPVDVMGELFVAGPSLARGYHALPAKTAASYVPALYSDKKGARMFRTGDVVSWNSDGFLRFHGRIDDQVQLRGMRIELEALESDLERASVVRQAAVRAVESDDGRVEALAGYVVSEKDEGVESDELRSHLSEYVDASKIPGRFIDMEALPKTPSGKVDRKALPDPGGMELAAGEELEEPETELEDRLAEIWCDVVGLERVGRDVNFFEIGGNSLAAMRAHHRIREDLDVELEVVHLFEHTTIRELGEFLERLDSEEEEGGRSEETAKEGRERGKGRRDALQRGRRRSRRGNGDEQTSGSE